MNTELYMVLLPGLCWILFALGGTQISKTIKGKKWIRRFLIPAVIMIAMVIAHFSWWRVLLTGGLTYGILTMGYGDRAGWPKRFGIGVGYAVCTAFVGLSWWNLVTACMFPIMFFASNLPTTAKMWTWKIVEGAIGAFIGIQVAYKLMGA